VSTRRRLEKLERALPASSAVLLWFESANQARTILSYVRACLEQPDPNADLVRLRNHVVRPARASDLPASQVARATAVALRDAALTYQLLLVLNGAAQAFADWAVPRSVFLVAELGRLLLEDPSGRVASSANSENAATDRGSWQVWRESVEALVGEVHIESEARAVLERSYFAGRSVLFAEIADAWGPLAAQAAGLETLVGQLREPFRAQAGFDRPPILPQRPGSLETRVQLRAAELLDDARIGALQQMGQRAKAVAIMERRLRS
jgi:hypothetical protein